MQRKRWAHSSTITLWALTLSIDLNWFLLNWFYFCKLWYLFLVCRGSLRKLWYPDAYRHADIYNDLVPQHMDEEYLHIVLISNDSRIPEIHSSSAPFVLCTWHWWIFCSDTTKFIQISADYNLSLSLELFVLWSPLQFQGNL